jgi:hypothetical protein
MTDIMPDEARALAADVLAIPDDKLLPAWESLAAHISYLNADDRGGDWKMVPQWRPALTAIGEEIKRRGLPDPDMSRWLL